jgi:hypothetical protein
VAISLGTTVIFLLFVQITKAIGAGGVINPVVAAWIPNVIFLFAGLVLVASVWRGGPGAGGLWGCGAVGQWGSGAVGQWGSELILAN